MAITQIGATVTGNGLSSATTGSANTSGASLLVVTIGAAADVTTITVSDSNSNTWHHLNNQAGGAQDTGIWYSFDKAGAALVTGAGHTVTTSLANAAMGITFSAFSGTLPNHVDPFDSVAGQSGGSNAAGTTVQPGSITATLGSLVVTSFGHAGTTTASSISFPYIIGGDIAGVINVSVGNAVGFNNQVTTTNPTWTASASTILNATIASFLAAPSSVTTTTPTFPLSQLVLNPIRPSGTQLQIGQSVLSSVALLSQGISNPQRLAEIVYESVQALLSQIQAIQNLLNAAPTVQSLSINSADIANLNVGQATGPGQLNVYGGPPTFPLVGWAGTDPNSVFPVLNISNITGGVVTTTSAHNLAVNEIVFIAGTSNAADNGTFVVATTPLTTTFTAAGISGASSGGTVQRQGVGGWFKTLAVGGSGYADVVTNQDGFWVDESGVPHMPGQFMIRGTYYTGAGGMLSVNGITWTDNSPVAGSIAWSACTVTYQGVIYSIPAGSTGTTNFYVTWTVGAPTVFTAVAGGIGLGVGGFVVAINTHDEAGNLGRTSIVHEVRNSANDFSEQTATDFTIYTSVGNLSTRIRRAIAAAGGVLDLADGTGAGSLGGGVKITASGSDGKVQMATFETNVANSSGGNTYPNFLNMNITTATAGTNGDVPAQTVGYLRIKVGGSEMRIPYYNP